MPFYAYLLRCADGSLYCGSTSDVSKRVREHNESPAGAKYTRGRRPVELAYAEVFETRSQALRREAEMKKLPRARKRALAAGYLANAAGPGFSDAGPLADPAVGPATPESGEAAS